MGVHVSKITIKQQISNILHYHMARRNVIMKTILKSFNGHRDAYVNHFFKMEKINRLQTKFIILFIIENYKYHTYLIVS